MSANPVPESLRSDHLFLLIGANTLPNWVAARLLLRPTGQLYLVHSDETRHIAERLARRLIKQGYRQPEYVAVENAWEAHKVYQAVEKYKQTIRSGNIGLNYTGGTKVMSVHAYRGLEKNLRGVPEPVFSYLDPRTLQIRFDHAGRLHDGHKPEFVGLVSDVQLTLDELFALSDNTNPLRAKREPIALPVAEAIAKLHYTLQGYEAWRKWSMKLDQDAGSRLKSLKEWPSQLSDVAIKLAQGNDLSTTLEELCRKKVWPFSHSGELAKWLHGMWLESYVFSILKKNQTRYCLNDCARNLSCRFADFKIEADVAAMRGYQLHFISCYTGDNTIRSTFKLLEAFLRARQVGGDEANTALVCMSENPKSIEADVAQAWQAEGRVKVFGRADLPNLEEKLAQWFKIDVQK